jgi:phosphatidylglycerol:prolipoprotein diacylglycerol transferase
VSGNLLNAYSATALAGITLSLLGWWRFTRKRRDGATLIVLYLAGLAGAIAGAKLGFLIAEGWHYRHDWAALLTGRTIAGGLLGGYAGVEWAKRVMGYRRPTGDLFAVAVPSALALGRVGCILQGCCPGVECAEAWWALHDARGVPRWPAAPAELAFNLLAASAATLFARRGRGGGQLFHLYLMAYGVFRFAHEFARDDARWIGPFGGYHLLALGLFTLGAVRYAQRRRAALTAQPAPSPS